MGLSLRAAANMRVVMRATDLESTLLADLLRYVGIAPLELRTMAMHVLPPESCGGTIGTMRATVVRMSPANPPQPSTVVTIEYLMPMALFLKQEGYLGSMFRRNAEGPLLLDGSATSVVMVQGDLANPLRLHLGCVVRVGAMAPPSLAP